MICHALTESNVWGNNSKITSVNDPNMLYSISVMINEEISCLRLAYLLQLMVETLNETAIYHIKILAQHKRAPNMSYKILNIPLKINVPCMEMMKTYCVEVNLNLESHSNCNFLTKIFFFLFYVKFWKKLIQNKEKQKKLFQLCFMLSNHYNCLFLYKNWKRKFLLHFISFIPKKMKK